MTSGVLARCREKFGTHDELSIALAAELAVLCDHRGDVAEAERIFKEVIAADERTGKSDTEDYYLAIGNLGSMLRINGRVQEAEPLCLRAYLGFVKLKGENDPTAIDMKGVYGDVLRLQGRLAEAEPLMRDYFSRAMTVYGPDHTGSINAEQGLAIVLEMQGKSDEAAGHFRNALGRMRQLRGNDHRETLPQVLTMAAQCFKHGDYAEAEQLFREAHQGWARAVGPNHPKALSALNGLVVTYYPSRNWAQALEPAKELFERLRDPQAVQIPPDRRARYLAAYGVVLEHLGRSDEAAEPLKVAYEAMIKEGARPKGFIDAYASVVRALLHIAEQKGDAVQAAFWTSELSRFGDVLPPRAFPATRPATTSPTTSPTTTATAPARS